MNEFSIEEIKKMDLDERFYYMQSEIIPVKKQSKNPNEKFSFEHVKSSDILLQIRKLLQKYRIILKSSVINEEFKYIEGKSNCMYVILRMKYIFKNIDNKEDEDIIEWSGHGLDVGERCIGKAYTYSEKYMLLKKFQIETYVDDPDNPKNININGNDNDKNELSDNKKLLKTFAWLYCKNTDEAKKEDFKDKNVIKKYLDYAERFIIENSSFTNKEGKIIKGLPLSKLSEGRVLTTLKILEKKHKSYYNFAVTQVKKEANKNK